LNKWERKYLTDNEAIGYMILAGKALRIDPRIIKKFEVEMKYQMNMKVEEKAQKAYKTF
jgi:hypothetical protein